MMAREGDHPYAVSGVQVDGPQADDRHDDTREIHRASRNRHDGHGVVPVLGGEAAPRVVGARLSWSNLLSRVTVRGISKLGEPSRPTPSRTSPVDRDHDLRREQAVVARLALRRVGDAGCRGSSRAPIDARDTRKDVLE